jgi:hypothetical protein
LIVGNAVPKEKREAFGKALEEIEDIMFGFVFNSNFDTSAAEACIDLGIGTCAILIEWDAARASLVFTAIPLKDLLIEEGPHGLCDTVFREYKMSGSNVARTWGKRGTDELELAPEKLKLLEDAPTHEFDVCEGTVPMQVEVVRKDGRKEKVQGFRYLVYIKELSDKYVVERDLEVSPWVVARWAKMPGETYGRGPAINAYSDAQTLNRVVELHLRDMEKSIDPPLTAVDDGIINLNNIKISSGAVIPVGSNGGGLAGPTLQPLLSGGNAQKTQLELQRLEASINDMMFTEPLGPINAPVKTATELSLRQQELSKRIGSSFGRLMYEFMGPLVNGILYTLDRVGKIDLNDFRVDGNVLALQHVSPIAQAQDQEDLGSIMRYTEFMIMTFGPEMSMMLMNAEALSQTVAEKLGVPMDIRPTDEQKAQVMQLIQAMGQSGVAQNGTQGQQGGASSAAAPAGIRAV